jgi:hypothetical protein
MDLKTIRHLPALATIGCSCLVSDQFADSAQQILWIRKPYRDALPDERARDILEVTDLAAAGNGPPGNGYARDWRSHYDYLNVKYASPGTRLHLPGLNLVYQGSSFSTLQGQCVSLKGAGASPDACRRVRRSPGIGWMGCGPWGGHCSHGAAHHLLRQARLGGGLSSQTKTMIVGNTREGTHPSCQTSPC